MTGTDSLAQTVREFIEDGGYEYIDTSTGRHAVPLPIPSVLAALDELVGRLAQAERALTEADGDWHLIAATQAERAEKAERENAALREALRPFVEDFDFHAAPHLADDDPARVFAARTVDALIAAQKVGRDALASHAAPERDAE